MESILQQSFENYEMLLIDDGSTDGSGRICDEYSTKDHRIRSFHKNNGGVSSARNLGLEHAEGKYVVFIDPDDCLLEKHGLEEAYNKLESSNLDLIMWDYKEIDIDGNDIPFAWIDRSRYASKILWPDDTIKYLINGHFYTPTILWKRDILAHTRFLEGCKILEDVLFIMTVFTKNPELRCGFLPVQLYGYRRHASYSSNLDPKIVVPQMMDIVDRIYRLATDCQDPRMRRAAFSQWAMFYYWNLQEFCRSRYPKIQQDKYPYCNREWLRLMRSLPKWKVEAKYLPFIMLPPMLSAQLFHLKFKLQ